MAKKHFEIINRTPDRSVIGVNMGKGFQGKFKNGIIRTTDEGLARDIRQSIGQEGRRNCNVLVAEVPDRSKKITSTGFGPGKWDEIRKEQGK